MFRCVTEWKEWVSNYELWWRSSHFCDELENCNDQSNLDRTDLVEITVEPSSLMDIESCCQWRPPEMSWIISIYWTVEWRVSNWAETWEIMKDSSTVVLIIVRTPETTKSFIGLRPFAENTQFWASTKETGSSQVPPFERWWEIPCYRNTTRDVESKLSSPSIYSLSRTTSTLVHIRRVLVDLHLPSCIL